MLETPRCGHNLLSNMEIVSSSHKLFKLKYLKLGLKRVGCCLFYYFWSTFDVKYLNDALNGVEQQFGDMHHLVVLVSRYGSGIVMFIMTLLEYIVTICSIHSGMMSVSLDQVICWSWY